jgi:hypothetical protein
MIPYIDYYNQLISYRLHLVRLATRLVVRSLRDYRSTVTGGACVAWVETDSTRKKGASGRRNHPPDGILRGGNRGTYFDPFSSAGDFGEGGSGISKRRPARGASPETMIGNGLESTC